MKKGPEKAMILIFAAVYLFFFTSKLTLGSILAGKAYRNTELGVPFELSEDISVTVVSWTEDTEMQLMEVELEILNTRSDMDRSYTFEAFLRSDPDAKPFGIECETVLSTPMYTVIWLYTDGVSYSEAVLRIKDKDKNSLSLYTNRDSVKRVRGIEPLTFEGYQVRRYTGRLEDIELRVGEILTETEELKVKAENLEKLNDEILLTFPVLSSSDLKKRDELIRKNTEEADRIKDEILILERELDELSEERDRILEEIEKLKGEDRT